MVASAGANYQLWTSPPAFEQCRALAVRSAGLGLAHSYAEALAFVYERLTRELLAWGDPHYRYHYLGLLVCQGLHPLLQVTYGVDESQRMVYLTKVLPRPGSALAPDT